MSSIHDDFYEKDEKKEQEKSDGPDKIPRPTAIKMTPISRFLLVHCLKQPHPLFNPLGHLSCSVIHSGKHPGCPFIHSRIFWNFDNASNNLRWKWCEKSDDSFFTSIDFIFHFRFITPDDLTGSPFLKPFPLSLSSCCDELQVNSVPIHCCYHAF